MELNRNWKKEVFNGIAILVVTVSLYYSIYCFVKWSIKGFPISRNDHCHKVDSCQKLYYETR